MNKTAGRPANRPIRRTIGVRDVLTAPKKKGFFRCIVNDKENRVEIYEQNGFSVVSDKAVQIGEKEGGVNSRMGTPVRMPVGNGQYGVLMEIPEEDHKEYLAAIENKIKEYEEETNKPQTGQIDGLVGFM